MPDIAKNEPLELRAGLTWQWRREDLVDYPASQGWALAYWFKLEDGSANFKIDAAADGDAFAVDENAAATEPRTAGLYTWAAIATKGADSFEADRGTLKVLPRYDQAASLDDRSHARKCLEAIRAVLERRATRDQEEFTIDNRQLKRTPIADLLRFKNHYETLVKGEEQAEKLANGIGVGRKVQVRFT